MKRKFYISEEIGEKAVGIAFGILFVLLVVTLCVFIGRTQ